MIAILFLALFGQAVPQQHPSTTIANSSASNDISKLTEVAYQMSKSLGNLPNDMQRIAPCQFKAEARDFTPGMLRQIQARLETVLRESGRTVVAAPELKTLRIFRARGGEVVWSDNFVADPNKSDRTPLDLDFSASVPFRMFPVASFHHGSKSYGNAYLLSNISFEATVTENITLDKRFQVSMSLGYTHLSLYGNGVPDSVYHPDIHVGNAGLELLGVFFRKPNPDMGYWLGAYVGYEQFLPLLYREPLGAFRFGYRSKLSRHFSLSGGVMVMPFQNTMTGIVSNDGQKFNLEKIGYEIAFLHYTF